MIDKMTPEEKSVVLARLCGWLKTDEYFHSYHPPNGKGMSVNYTKGYAPEFIFVTDKHYYDLYNVRNFALAWQVLNWAMKSFDNSTIATLDEWFSFIRVMEMPPAEAQAAWLDKILELAIEAGMVNDEN